MPVVDLRSDFDAFPHLPILLTPNEPGNMQQLLLSSTYGEYEFRWQKLYGPVYRLKGCFELVRLHRTFSLLIPSQQDRLMVSDPVSLQYILNSTHFIRADPRGYVIFIGRREKCYAGQWLVLFLLDAYRWSDHDIPQTMIINGFEPP
jgi:hypothetical protein